MNFGFVRAINAVTNIRFRFFSASSCWLSIYLRYNLEIKMQKIKMQLHWKHLINVRCLPFVSFVKFNVSSKPSVQILKNLDFLSNQFVVILFFDLNIINQCSDIVFCCYSVLMFWHVKQQVICMWEYRSYRVLANDSFVLFFSNTINLSVMSSEKQ